MKQKVKVLTISDLHWGAIKPASQLDEEAEIFFSHIDETVDIIVICGDYFHKKLSLNSEYAIFANQMMIDLINLCKKHNIVLRILKGTDSHDLNQLENYISTLDNISLSNEEGEEEVLLIDVINSVRSEAIPLSKCNDTLLFTLFLPEEYVIDQYKYYEKYYNDEEGFDIIFGHGTFKFTAFVSQQQESENQVHSSVVFDEKEIADICTGLVIFGHIHNRISWNNKVFYNGSYSRWSFGEEEPKGFLETILTIDLDLGIVEDYVVKFIENTKARKYITIDSDVFNDLDITESFDVVESYKRKYDYVRIKGKMNDIVKAKALFESYSNDETLKISSTTTLPQDVKVISTEYEFLFNKNLPIEEAIQKFIELKFSKTIKLTTIKDSINEEKSIIN